MCAWVWEKKELKRSQPEKTGRRRLLLRRSTILAEREGAQHKGMSNYKCGFVYACRFVISTVGALLLFTVTAAARVESRVNLPQAAAEVRLNAEAKLELDSMLEGWTGDATQAIAPGAWRLLLASLPAELRNGCRAMLSDFETMVKVDRDLSVRILYAERVNGERTAILAFRCTVHIPEVTAYDERPAVLVSDKEGAVLRLVSLAEDCNNCSDLYHVGYSQKFAAAAGYLAELNVEHSTDNPCCDGGDSHGGSDLLLVAVPEGAKLLAFEKDTDDYNHDDEAGDAQTACRSEISYERDRQGRLQAIDARTSCTENGKSKPPIKATRFEWNVREKRFLQRKGDEKSD